jgi:PAS domain S-box-containing protein/TyrR family helix-turn-helix protein
MVEVPTYGGMLNAFGSGVVATDSVGNIVFLNSQAQEILGLGPGVYEGASLFDKIPRLGPVVRKCLNTGQDQPGHPVMGENTGLVVTVTLIRERECVKGVLCHLLRTQDLEALAEKLESYNRLNKQWNAIFKSSSDGILVCDGKGNIMMMNEASEKLNGIEARVVIGRNVAVFVKNATFDRSVTLEVLETKRQVSLIQYIKKTGKYLLVTGTPAFDEQGNIFLVVVNERDMTQLNAMKEELEQNRLVTEKFKDELAEMSMMELRRKEIIAESGQMRQALRVAFKLARLEASNILILGESGTGKGLLAKFIHENSKRKDKPFIQINCAALPENLLEAELFGYEKGAFTGAREQGKAGLFELSHGGTLFLDEIGDLPLSVQAKLLKYLDDHEVMRLGSLKPRRLDCTVIAATNRNLEALTRDRLFRDDLFYRLNAFTIRIPPLRDRPEDIFELVAHLLRKYNSSYRLKRRISFPGLKVLQSHAFPGNVRELKNILKRAMLMSERDALDDFIIASLSMETRRSDHPVESSEGHASLTRKVTATERGILEKAMTQCKSTRALAKYLGISQPTVVRKLKKYGLSSYSIR